MNRQDLRIIVEGMDGGGKSTLVNKLVYDFDNLEIVRNDEEDRKNFEKWWPEQLDRQKSSIVPIHDRFFFSELVYGPVIRGRLSVGQTLINNVVWFLRSTSLLIYARPHSNILRDVVRKMPQMDGVKENFQPLLELYDNIMAVEASWFEKRFIRYDWNSPESYPAVTAKVRAYLDGKLS